MTEGRRQRPDGRKQRKGNAEGGKRIVDIELGVKRFG
jgi:hypothetical protein